MVILYSTDEDARQAMMHTGGKIKEIQVSLLLSSRTEMQKVIDTARQKVLGIQSSPNFPPATPQIPAITQSPNLNQPVIPNIPQNSPQLGLPLAAQLVAAQRMLPMLGIGLPQITQPQQHPPNNQIPMPHQQQQLHPHIQQQQQHQGPQMHNHQGPQMHNHQGPQMHHQGPPMQPHVQQMQQHQQHMHQQQMQQHGQQHGQQQNNMGANQRRISRDDKNERRRSRSRDRKRSRERTDRRSSDGAKGRRRRSRSRSRDRDRTRRRDRSRSREKSKERNREGRGRRDREDRPRGGKPEKGSGSGKDEPPANGSTSVSPINNQPMPWANPAGNMGVVSPRGMMNQGMPRFPPFQQPAVQADLPAWGQHAFNPQQTQGQKQANFQGPNNNSPASFDNKSGRLQRPQETCVEICYMTQHIAYRDIREYFQDQHVLNIKLVCDEEGRKTGRGYIKFGTPESKVEALQLSGANFKGNQRFEIKDCSEVDYDRALDSYQPNQEPAVVSINNIPPYANDLDVKRVFHGARIHNVVLMHPGENKAVPSAFVQFSTVSEKNRAISASGKVKIDGQEIFITESSFEAIFRAQKALQKKGRDEEKRLPIIKDDGPVVSECILLQGLPPSVNNREILDFFSDVGVIPLHIHIMQDESSVPMGDAFCEFRNPIEGARALGKNKAVLGNTEITAKAVTRQDMEMTLNLPKKMPPQQLPPQMPGMMPRNGQEQMRHSMRPPHFMGRPPFDARNSFPMRAPFPRGPMPPHMMGMRPRPPFPGPGMNPGMNGPPSGEPSVDNFGKPGCVVEVTNVPYQAEVDEILSFFSEFELTRQNVIRRFNDMGKPTGDVRVAFNTPQDAQRALASKYKKIRDRQIFLNLLS